MLIILWITFTLMLLSMAYPFFLLFLPKIRSEKGKKIKVTDAVSVILFSYNNREYLENKINRLLEELRAFRSYELIIVDNESTDGSRIILDRFASYPNIKIIFNCQLKSVACSMNIGVRHARYEYIIMCDLRQELSVNSLRILVQSLQDKRVGAVSACLCSRDKSGKVSPVRRIENMIKKLEGRSGNLIGVYGPFYGIRKSCYTPIPEHILLEDLYLSLSTHQIIFRQDCLIIDNDFTSVYNIRRAKKYVKGLIQLIQEKKLMSKIRLMQLFMLLWHKYFRLFIPLLILLNFIFLSILTRSEIYLLIALFMFTIAALIPDLSMIHSKLKDILRINFYYLVLVPIILFQPVLMFFNRLLRGREISMGTPG